MAGTPTEIADEIEAPYAAGLNVPLLLADWLNLCKASCLRTATADAQRICKLDAARPSQFATTAEPIHLQRTGATERSYVP
jgi:hypothetical protein